MLARLLPSLDPKKVLVVVLAALLLAAGLSFGSYRLAEKDLTARRGPLAAIPRNARQVFVDSRGAVGPAAATVFVLVASGWAGATALARAWQKSRNQELAANAVLLRIAPRVDEQSKWQTAGDLWRAIHSTLERPGWQTWLGAGLHFSLEVVQLAGERVTFYLWSPRPLAETLVRQLRATYAGLEIETLVRSGGDGA